MSDLAVTVRAMADTYRPLHDLDCPARSGDVPDEDVPEACICWEDGRFLNPRAKPVPEPENMAARPVPAS